MRAEIISVGTELLLGQVVNTNSAYIAKKLASLSIEVYHHITVGDNAERIKEAIEAAESRSDMIILSGGLGPTEDDITKQVLSEYLDVELVLHEDTQNKIITYHKNSDFEMPKNNQLQALMLMGAIPLLNDTGLAVGSFLEKGDHSYIILPGPPDELEPMVENHLTQVIVDNILDEQKLVSRIIRLFGLTESQLALKLEKVIQNQMNPTIAIYAEGGELTIRITAKGQSEEECDKMINKVEKAINKEVKEFVFGYGEKNLSDVIKDILIEQEKKITAAESLTGGAFLSSISSDLAAGSIFDGGIVTYSSDHKHKTLGISQKVIDNFGVVSPECAIEMAERVRDMFEADIAVSLTGVAGPSALEGNIPGTVWIGIALNESKSFAKHYHFAYKRNKNRRLAVQNALDLVRRVLLDMPISKRIYCDEENL